MSGYSYTIAYRTALLTRPEQLPFAYPGAGVDRSACALRYDTGRPCPLLHKDKDNDMCTECPVRLGMPSDLTAAQVAQMAQRELKVVCAPVSYERKLSIPNARELRIAPGKCDMPWCEEELKAGQGRYCRSCRVLIYSRMKRGDTDIDALHAPLSRRRNHRFQKSKGV